MTGSIKPTTGFKGITPGRMSPSAFPASLNTNGAGQSGKIQDGFTASKELSRGGFADGMPPVSKTDFSNGMPAPTQVSQPQQQDQDDGTGNMWAMLGLSLAGKLIEKLFGGGGQDGGAGGCSGGG
ncbi:MAG: hypothetical protein AB2L14_13350 [Candidatus Xenobiia bacterium LiM19]